MSPVPIKQLIKERKLQIFRNIRKEISNAALEIINENGLNFQEETGLEFPEFRCEIYTEPWGPDDDLTPDMIVVLVQMDGKEIVI